MKSTKKLSNKFVWDKKAVWGKLSPCPFLGKVHQQRKALESITGGHFRILSLIGNRGTAAGIYTKKQNLTSSHFCGHTENAVKNHPKVKSLICAKPFTEIDINKTTMTADFRQ